MKLLLKPSLPQEWERCYLVFITDWPFSKMEAENSNALRLKTYQPYQGLLPRVADFPVVPTVSLGWRFSCTCAYSLCSCRSLIPLLILIICIVIFSAMLLCTLKSVNEIKIFLVYEKTFLNEEEQWNFIFWQILSLFRDIPNVFFFKEMKSQVVKAWV